MRGRGGAREDRGAAKDRRGTAAAASERDGRHGWEDAPLRLQAHRGLLRLQIEGAGIAEDLCARKELVQIATAGAGITCCCCEPAH